MFCRPKVPRDAGWAEWTSWSSCQSNCRQVRNRTCDNPTAMFGGNDCTGDSTEMTTEACYGDDCCPGLEVCDLIV